MVRVVGKKTCNSFVFCDTLFKPVWVALLRTAHAVSATTEEKAELLKLLSAEKEEKRALMPPADEKRQKSPNWLLRLVGAR